MLISSRNSAGDNPFMGNGPRGLSDMACAGSRNIGFTRVVTGGIDPCPTEPTPAPLPTVRNTEQLRGTSSGVCVSELNVLHVTAYCSR